jgi:hypothetical protein
MVYEIDCAGGVPLEEWYAIPVWDRTLKVAAKLLPDILAHLESIQSRAESELDRARSKAKAG